jgi:hypothetical protein
MSFVIVLDLNIGLLGIMKNSIPIKSMLKIPEICFGDEKWGEEI